MISKALIRGVSCRKVSRLSALLGLPLNMHVVYGDCPIKGRHILVTVLDIDER